MLTVLNGAQFTRRIFFGAAASLLVMMVSCKGSASDDGGEIIARVRAALDRWGNGDIQGPLDVYAPGITYFDPFQEKRVEGIEAMRKLYAPIAGKLKIGRYEMIDPKVQRHGDVAVLTFNLVDYVIRQPDGPGNVRVPWNCTQVYVRTGGKWSVIHEHWSFIKPQPVNTPIR